MFEPVDWTVQIEVSKTRIDFASQGDLVFAWAVIFPFTVLSLNGRRESAQLTVLLRHTAPNFRAYVVGPCGVSGKYLLR